MVTDLLLQVNIHLDCPSLPSNWELHDWIYNKTLSAGLQLPVLSPPDAQMHFPGAAERVELFLDNILVELRYAVYILSLQDTFVSKNGHPTEF